MPSSFALTPIGHARSTRTVVEDDRWDAETCSIELDARFGADALAGLETFSHVEVVFVMDRVGDDAIVTGARHPRNNPSWPAVGIFAQRAKNRPNRLGTWADPNQVGGGAGRGGCAADPNQVGA